MDFSFSARSKPLHHGLDLLVNCLRVLFQLFHLLRSLEIFQVSWLSSHLGSRPDAARLVWASPAPPQECALSKRQPICSYLLDVPELYYDCALTTAAAFLESVPRRTRQGTARGATPLSVVLLPGDC